MYSGINKLQLEKDNNQLHKYGYSHMQYERYIVTTEPIAIEPINSECPVLAK